ncbi:MAG: NifB/NifX family molybdenum-iron cluster-binding protein [Candidatus Nanoarchaeia archaeon]|jgi:predicted Fe-Mo cluster-binding NifX family protein
MKIAISSNSKTINGEVSEIFGRCPYFIIMEDGKVIEVIKNISINQRGGAGISAAKLVAEKNVDAVMAGNIGPRALSVLKQFNIKTYLKKGLIKNAVSGL